MSGHGAQTEPLMGLAVGMETIREVVELSSLELAR